ncbi:MSCRAMM family adhesin SdrC [Mycolicibacterium palauense]|uniref:MSCRAMM family adhesin SdrC n=1 Tax=Mycolicibacterium palauense TaxID=2034511 RepID=UPI001FE39601|nr:MSCRAMM family adhesin SdrC [Mycolicibacterium palauense]
MEISARTMLTAGVAALTAGALVFAPNVRPASMRNAEVIRPVSFAADTAPLPAPGPVAPLTEEDLESALALLDQLGEISGHGAVTVKPGSHRSGPRSGVPTEPAETVIAAPSATDRTVAPAAAVPGGADVDEVPAEPGQLNAASDIIDNVYDVTRYWANYVSLELGPWLINWVPFGYLVSDQIYIWYPDFVLPVVDSFVYDFLDPVVNDPLNLQVWLNGIGAILNTAFNGVVEGINDEIDYVLSFGWFPIPLPPLPDFPLPGAASSADAVDVALAASALASAEDAGSDATDKSDKSDKSTDKDGSTGTSGEAGEAPSDPAGDEGSTESTDPTESTDATDETTAPTDETTDESTDAGSEQAPPEDTGQDAGQDAPQDAPQDTEAPAAQDDGTGSEDTPGSEDTTGSEDTATDPGSDDEADADAEAADEAAAEAAAEEAAAEAELEDTGGTNGDAQDGAASSTGSGADTGTGSGTDAGADAETATVTVGGDSGSGSGDN